MGFKQNLRKKIEIEELANKVIGSIGTAESGSKVDKNAMRKLLEMSDYRHQRERDMDLYLHDGDSGRGAILVLDNDLTIYHSTLDDVVMRKNPLIKEMVSIRNVIKILNDKDVVVSRKAQSVERVRNECLAKLDLSWKPEDIADIAREGIASLHSNYAEGVSEVLQMFAELLDYGKPPQPLRMHHFKIYGRLQEVPETAGQHYGPVVLYSLAHSEIKLIEREIRTADESDVEFYHAVAAGAEKPDRQQDAVFEFLKEAVLRSDASAGHA
ncbi:MAG TPA: hypothetical protein ACFCUC_13210 [Desulfobacterales bacterium]